MDFLRQLDLFNPDADYAKNVKINVIGCGGIGSFGAMALSKLGMKNLILWDGDNVEPHNLPNQFFYVSAVGKNKAEALATLIYKVVGYKPEVKSKFWEGEELEGVVISAVDNQNVRKAIWEKVKNSLKVSLLLDCRIGGEFLRIISIRPINDVEKYSSYELNLFSQEEGEEMPCTGRAIIDIGFMMGALITRAVRRFLKDEETDYDIFISESNLDIQRFEP